MSPFMYLWEPFIALIALVSEHNIEHSTEQNSEEKEEKKIYIYIYIYIEREREKKYGRIAAELIMP